MVKPDGFNCPFNLQINPLCDHSKTDVRSFVSQQNQGNKLMRQLSTPTFMGSKMGFDRALSKNHFSPPNQQQVLPPNAGHMDDMNRGRGGFRNGFNGPNRGFNDRRPNNGR